MDAISELRPVEALYLLETAGKEKMDLRSSLAATLVYLANEGYIEPIKHKCSQGIGLNLTEKGKTEGGSLLEFEVESLDAIEGDDIRHLVYGLDNFDFRKGLAGRGFFTAAQRQKRFLIFKWNVTDYFPTEKYNQAIRELDELKGKIDSAVANRAGDKHFLCMSYAFPSSGLSDMLMKYAREFSDTADAVEAASLAAIHATSCGANLLINAL